MKIPKDNLLRYISWNIWLNTHNIFLIISGLIYMIHSPNILSSILCTLKSDFYEMKIFRYYRNI